MAKIIQFTCWLLVLAAIAATYRTGLSGPLLFDDIPNIVDNDRLKITDLRPKSLYQAAVSGRATEFGRPLSMMSFGVNHVFSPSSSYALKLTNLVIHLANVLLAGALVLVLVRSYPCFAQLKDRAPAIAFVSAAAWGLHPMQMSTVLYTVQRMTLLSALFTIAALIAYMIGRTRQQQGKRGSLLILSSLLVFVPLAFLSKETGILFFAYVLAIELFATQPAQPGAKMQFGTRWLLAIGGAGILVVGLFIALKAPTFAASYYTKGFTAVERLLTEPRVLIWYLKMIVVPDIREMGLTHDDWPVSHSLLQPPSTLLALGALLVAVAALPWLRMRWPVGALCIGLFLAGHSIEAGPLPLDLVYEHRNYFPSLAIFVALTSVGARALDHGRAARLAPAIVVAILTTLSSLTYLRVYEWQNPVQWALAQTKHHPGSAFSFMDLGSIYASTLEHVTDAPEREMLFARADAAFAEAFRLNPRLASGLVSRIIMRLRAQREVPQELFDQLTQTLKSGAIPASAQSAVLGLVDCTIEQKCDLDDVHLMAVISAALENPGCPGFFSSQLLALTGEYYGRKGDVRMAVTMMKAATEVPDGPLQVWLGLIRWLIVGGYLVQASEALDEMDRRDKVGEFSRERQEIRQDLRNAFGRDSGNADQRPNAQTAQ
jgi:protein O-mannosyl-transferase